MDMLNILIVIVIVVCIAALAGTIYVTKRLDDNYERRKAFQVFPIFTSSVFLQLFWPLY